jgi:hypothetical protein
MSRPLTASDRSALIRLASTLPVGSSERRAILAGLGGASGSSKVAGASPFIRPAIQHLLSIEDGFGDVSDPTDAPYAHLVKTVAMNLTLSVKRRGGIEVRSYINPDAGIRVEDMAKVKGHLERFFGCKFQMALSNDNRFAYYRQSTDITPHSDIG